jgi:hypothetical protein
MKMRRRRDDDEVDVVRGADLLRAGKASAALFRESGPLVERESGDGDDLRAIQPHGAVRVHSARETRTEDADPQ